MDDAAKLIVTLLGGGGLTAIILGVLGFLKGRAQDTGDASRGTVTMAAMYADHGTLARISSALERHADSVDRQTKALMDHTEAVRDTVRAVKRFGQS